MLAGLSVDYIMRLEQGRSTNPSPQVLSALARALRLATAEREHLFVLRVAAVFVDVPADQDAQRVATSGHAGGRRKRTLIGYERVFSSTVKRPMRGSRWLKLVPTGMRHMWCRCRGRRECQARDRPG
jgi:transcriptional regulator with XRE-family HTH domain